MKTRDSLPKLHHRSGRILGMKNKKKQASRRRAFTAELEKWYAWKPLNAIFNVIIPEESNDQI